ncbi:MAG: RelA/SpoT family protein [Bacteroidia bacterium]|nr:RelA/SpoT family protein [Bacteroidia bacterium]
MVVLDSPTYAPYKDKLQSKYDYLLSLLHDRGKSKLKKVTKAFEMAASAHDGVKRKSGEPYLFHPLEVAIIAVEVLGLGSTSAICALLHDTVEDTELTLEEIETAFDPKIKNIVDGLTKISTVFDTVEKNISIQAENFKKMLLTLGEDLRVILIKLCDRLHNMRTIHAVSQKTRLKIASETLYIYAPLAHRLGLNVVKSELEDLSLEVTDPLLYIEIKTKLEAQKQDREDYLKRFIKPLNEELKTSKLSVFDIQSRTKTVFSIAQKMRKQGIPFEEVYDLFAIRVILDSPLKQEKNDCWRVYAIISQQYTSNQSRLRDWLSKPKSNGYEALHTTIIGPDNKYIEVQIRSKRMDDVAERGVAAHWRYKSKEGEVKPNAQDMAFDHWMTQVKETLNNKDLSAIELINEFRFGILAEDIFIFTPKGEVKRLSKESTALDFAFAIHTDVGYMTIGAKVNGKLVPIGTELSNSDIVEILTTSKNRVNADWLKMVKTGKAKNKIKEYLNSQKNAFSSEGKEILQRKFKSAKRAFNNKNVAHFIKFHGFTVPNDFYHALAIGAVKQEKLKVAAFFKENPIEKINKQPKKGENKNSIPAKKKLSNAIVVGDEYEVEYAMASCCSPVPGDQIFGFITVNDGIKFHRSNCLNATNLMSEYGYRIVNCNWRDKSYDQSFISELMVNGIDDVGIVSSITNIISKDLGVNMRSINIRAGSEGTFEGVVEVMVKNLFTLEKLISTIQNKHQYIQVKRLDLIN